MSRIYDQLCKCNPERAIEVGTLCERCLEPINEDRRPPAEDWRVKIGRTKRLCPRCAEIEDNPGCEKVGEKESDPPYPWTRRLVDKDFPGWDKPKAERADQRTKEILEIVTPDLPGTRMADWETLFRKMFGKGEL